MRSRWHIPEISYTKPVISPSCARRAGVRLTALDVSLGAEIAAQAWSYAAARFLAFDPAMVFHDAGYRGAAESLRAAFERGPGAPGAPLLTWLGLSGDAYPTMIRWSNESEREP